MAKKATIEDFKKWISKLGVAVEYLDTIGSNDMAAGSRTMCVKLCTYLNEYRINVVYREHDNGWVGCCVPSRHLEGTLWTREDDIFSGDFTEKSWNKIMSGILAFETVKIKHLY